MNKLWICLLAVLLVVSFSCSKKQPESTVKVKPAEDATAEPSPAKKPETVIGAVLPLTGPYAGYGKRIMEGLEAAVAHLNKVQPDLGVKLVVADSEGKSEIASEAFMKVTANGALAVIGAVEPASTAAIAREAAAAGIALISPSCPTTGLETVNPKMVRLSASDNIVARTMADYVSNKLKLRIFGLYHEMEPLSQSYAVKLEARIKAEGGKIIIKRIYDPTMGNYKTDLKAIKYKNIEGLIVVGLSPEIHNIVRQAREVGLTKPIIGGAQWDRYKFPADINNVYYPSQLSPDSTQPLFKNLSDILSLKKSGPDSYIALGFDTALMLVHCIHTSPEKDVKAITENLMKAKDIPGATGFLSALPTEKNIYIISVKDGVKKVVHPEPKAN